MYELKRQELEEKLAETNIEFTKQDIDLFMDGKFSTLKENIELPDGKIKNGKIKLEIDNEGNIKLQYKFQEPEIVIPTKIGDKELSEEEQLALKNGKAIQFHADGNHMFIQIDKELNAIIIKTQHEIKLSEVDKFEMGGYVFDEKQKLQLENGDKVSGVVMKGQEGYFVATIRVKDDKKGFIFEDYIDISKEKAQELLSKRKMDNSISNITSITSTKETTIDKGDKSIVNTASVASQKPEEKELNKESSTTLSKEYKLGEYETKLYAAIKKDDFEKVTSLSQNKPPVSQTFINKLNNDKTISKDSKIASNTILQINPLSAKKEVKNNLEEKTNIKIEKAANKGKEQRPSSGHKRKAALGLIEKGMSDM